MANQPGKRRLILCGICFQADCPWSRWVDDDGITEALDEMREAYFERMHDELDRVLASKLTVEQKREKIQEAIEEIKADTGADVEIENLEALLGGEVKGIEKEIGDFKTDKGSFIEDILRNASETIERKENDKTKGH